MFTKRDESVMRDDDVLCDLKRLKARDQPHYNLRKII